MCQPCWHDSRAVDLSHLGDANTIEAALARRDMSKCCAYGVTGNGVLPFCLEFLRLPAHDLTLWRRLACGIRRRWRH
eukprot:2491699-Amphidinium_carterae.1